MPRKIKVRTHRRGASLSYTSRGPGVVHRNGKPDPLKIARGAGSINAEADMRQLVEAGLYAEAAELYEMHKQKAWMSPMRWGAEWYHQYKNGDTPQVREPLLP